MNPRDFIYWFLLAVLVAPAALAAPTIVDETTATIFVDGATDTFAFSPGLFTDVGTRIVITAPSGVSATVTKIALAEAGDLAIYNLNGANVQNTQAWSFQPSGVFDGVAANGTWTIEVRGPSYNSHTAGVSGHEFPMNLTVQGKSIQFGVSGSTPLSQFQVWNWHETTGVWVEPSTEPDAANEETLPEGPEEDLDNAKYFAPFGPAPPGVQDDDPRPFTGDNTVTCDSSLTINGLASAGQSQTENTTGLFYYVSGFQSASTDLRLVTGSQSTTLTDLGAASTVSHSEVVTYNNLLGVSYQFFAANGTGGALQDGLTVFAGPNQCDSLPPDLGAFNHDESDLELDVSQGQCFGDNTTISVVADNVISGGDTLTLYLLDAETGMQVMTWDYTEMYAGPAGQYFWFSRLIPPGDWYILAVEDQMGLGSNDHFDTQAFNVKAGSCEKPTFQDIEIIIQNDVALAILENVTDTNQGALLVNNMDFAGLSFDGFLFFLLFAGFMGWCLWYNYPFPALFAVLGAMSLFYASFPIGVPGFIFLCLLALWLQWYKQRRLDQKKKGSDF